MACKVVYNPDEDCVHVSVEGDVDLGMGQRCAKEIIKQLSAHHCLRLLNDMRKASVKVSTIDIYDFPAWIEEAGMNPSCKRALLVSKDFKDYEFFETVSRNHGQLVTVFADSSKTGVFHDIAEAYEWLGLTTTKPASGQNHRAPALFDEGGESVH